MGRHCLVFSVCHDLVPLSQPAPKQCFTPKQPLLLHNRCASTHFEENQLAPSSISISPLTAAHPTIFQHRRVRTSTWYYPSFILATVRSPGFGSMKSDNVCPVRTCFRCGSRNVSLTQPLPISRRLILQQARGQFFVNLPLIVSLRFHVLFHSPLHKGFQGSLSPFPRGTHSLSVIQKYLALRGGPR